MKVGKCHHCNKSVYLDDSGETMDDFLPAGDWDWVCYPCQFSLMDENKWFDYKEKMLAVHDGSGKCTH